MVARRTRTDEDAVTASRHLRAAYRVSLAGLAILAVVVATTFTSFRDISSVKDQTEEIERSLDHLALLTRARDELTQAQIAFGDALDSEQVTELTTGVAVALENFSSGTSAWNEYVESAGTSGPTPEDAKEIEDRLQAARSAGEAIAAQAIGDPSQAEAWKALFDTEIETYNAIRAEFDRIEREARAQIDVQADELGTTAGRDQKIILVAGSLVAIAVFVATVLVAFRAERKERTQLRLGRERGQVARRNALDANLQSALDMADSEEHALSVVGRALAEALPDTSAEVLIAGAGGAMVRRASAGPTVDGCDVPSIDRCPAARNGQRLVFPTPSSLDACWYLQDRPNGPCSAICAPLSVAGNSVGIVHVTGPDGVDASQHELATVDLIARKSSESLSTIRAFGHASTQARTDPLTGLLNRRSIEGAAAPFDDQGIPYIVAFADLDHFKELNDDHGHAAGDAALRLFARVLRSSVRPDDLVSRWGGEEFVLLLPDCSLEGAIEILDRIRANLSVALAGSELPPFTASFGAAPSAPTSSFPVVVAEADEHLLEAKAAGRNRIVAPS